VTPYTDYIIVDSETQLWAIVEDAEGREDGRGSELQPRVDENEPLKLTDKDEQILLDVLTG
jgi:hypothetical protein